MMRGVKLAALAVVLAAQLAVPGWMLGKREWVLRNGAEYKFRTAPVDPSDPFRGRYVALSFEALTAEYTDPAGVETFGRALYATLTVDDTGFAKFGRVSRTPPESGEYMRVETWFSGAPNQTQFVPPFDRYYMNESAAPAAEQAYREHSRLEAERAIREHSNVRTRGAYATVRVWKGYSVLDGLFLGDQRIEDSLADSSETP